MSAIDVPVWAWALLGILLLVFITIDLVAHRGDHPDSRKRAHHLELHLDRRQRSASTCSSLIQFGRTAGEQFLAAYLLEKSLSVDNLFCSSSSSASSAFRAPNSAAC